MDAFSAITIKNTVKNKILFSFKVHKNSFKISYLTVVIVEKQ